MSNPNIGLALRIEANPLGRLMYGQRELFHSNLLAWFFDVLPESGDQVFVPLSNEGVDSGRYVERERQNMDLVFHWPHRSPLVIENKVFSLPDLSQLDVYAQAVSSWPGMTPSLCILAMSEPALEPRSLDGIEVRFTSNGWRCLSYLELADRIEASLPPDSSYNVETMRHYVSLVRDLHQLISETAVRSDDEPVWLTDEALSPIGSSQMRAALRKARAQRVAEVVSQHIQASEGTVWSAISNSTPLVEWLSQVRIDGHDMRLGWQIQGLQFRRAVVYKESRLTGKSPAARERREEISRAHPEFFVFPSELNGTVAGRKEFNHYAPNFVYRYVKTPSITIGELKAAARVIQEEVTQLEHAADAPVGGAHISVVGPPV